MQGILLLLFHLRKLRHPQKRHSRYRRKSSKQRHNLRCRDAQQRGDLLYDVKKAKGHVEEWKAHLLRSENQDLAKRDALKKIKVSSILIFLDWAMKFVQMKYR